MFYMLLNFNDYIGAGAINAEDVRVSFILNLMTSALGKF